MNELQLFRGDTVFLKGNQGHETVCVIVVDNTCPNGCLRISRVIQNNIRVHSGDFVLIQRCTDIKYGKSIQILPIDDTIRETGENLSEVYLRPYFDGTYWPVYKGDTFIVRVAMRSVEFKIIDTDPTPYCIVTPDTIINWNGKPIKREEAH